MPSDHFTTLPDRKVIVSSDRFRKLEEYTNAQISTIFHRSLVLLGESKTLVVCNTMTNLALLRVLSETTIPNTVRISPFSCQFIYPTGIDTAEKASYSSEIGYICASKVGSKQLFVTNDTVDSNVTISRSSEVINNATTPIVTVLENEKQNILCGSTPYLVRFASHTNPGTVDITITIAVEGSAFTVNALTVIPVPIIGGSSIGSIYHAGVLPIYTNNHTQLVAETDFVMGKSAAAYIPFEPVKTTSLSFTLHSTLYSSELHCTAVGIAAIIAEHTIFSKHSYIGFLVTPPEGATKLTSIQTIPSPFVPQLDGVSYKLYTSLSSFNLIDQNYIANLGPNQYTNLDAVPYYVVMDIATTNGSTPVVNEIRFVYD